MLSDKAETLRASIIKDYGLSDAEQAVLDKGLEALDTSDKAQAIVDAEGVVINDRFGFPVRHPAAGVAKDARAQFLAAMKQLGLADPYGGEGGHGRGAQKGRQA